MLPWIHLDMDFGVIMTFEGFQGGVALIIQFWHDPMTNQCFVVVPSSMDGSFIQ